MHITDVDIKVTHGQGPLLATADLIIDADFVVHNIRIIRVSDRILVAMPSRVATAKCACGEKNPLNAVFCSGCGVRLPGRTSAGEVQDRQKLHSDIAHPISAAARNQLNEAVLSAYHAKVASLARVAAAP